MIIKVNSEDCHQNMSHGQTKSFCSFIPVSGVNTNTLHN